MLRFLRYVGLGLLLSAIVIIVLRSRPRRKNPMVSNLPRGSGRVTKPSEFPAVNPREGHASHDFNLQYFVDIQRTISSLETKVDRLVDDRKEDRLEYKADVKSFREDFKEFRVSDFKPLRDDVDAIKIKWAKIVGASAVVGAIASIAVEYLKTKIAG